MSILFSIFLLVGVEQILIYKMQVSGIKIFWIGKIDHGLQVFAKGFVLAETFSYILNDISAYFTIYMILFSSI